MEQIDDVRRFSPEVMASAGFPTIAYDELEVGTEFRSDDRLVRPQDVEGYAFMVDDDDDLFFEPGPFGPPVAHPDAARQPGVVPASLPLLRAGRPAREDGIRIPPARPPRHEGSHHRPCRRQVPPPRQALHGHRVRNSRRGRPTPDEVVGSCRCCSDPTPPPAAGSSSGPAAEPAPAIDATIGSVRGRRGSVEVGTVVTGPTRTVTQRQIDAYSGVRPGSIHTDESWATREGLPDDDRPRG